MVKNTKGIRAFLQDGKAVSPAIATLILIVIAAVAAAGVGILVQYANKNAQDQTANKNLDVVGTFGIKGSTTVLPISEAEIAAFQKLYPAVTINLGGGGSLTGRALVFNKQVEVGSSSDIWQTGPTTDTVTGLSLDGREEAVIQAAGKNAFVYETKIGTGMIVVAANIPSVTAINVYNDSGTYGSPYYSINKTLWLSFSDIRDAYAKTGDIPGTNITVDGAPSGWPVVTVVQRDDDSGTEETFAKWIGLSDSAHGGQLVTTSPATKAQGNQGIRDYVAAHSNSLGFVDIGFAAGGANGNAAVIPASMNGTNANKTTKGVPGMYNDASDWVNGAGNSKGLSRDLYYYSQPGVPSGALKAFLDFVMSNDGQDIVEKVGFFRP